MYLENVNVSYKSLNSPSMKNVVSFQTFHMARHYPEICALIEYWTSLLQTGSVPRRSDVDPRALGTCLPYIFLLDRVADADALIRICGTYLTTLFGEDAKGRPLSDLFTHHAHAELSTTLGRLWAHSIPSVFEITSDTPVDSDHVISGKVGILPLRDAFGGVTKAIGILQTGGRIKYPPYTFDINTFKSNMNVENLYPGTNPMLNEGAGHVRILS